MKNITKISYFISVAGHLIVLGMSWNIIKDKPPEDKVIMVYIQVPPDIPQIKTIGDKKLISKNEKEVEAVNDGVGEIKQEENKNSQKSQKEMLQYHNIVKQRIQEARQYPKWAKEHNIQGCIELEFIIQRSGIVKEISIIGPSGSVVLDKEAVDTIKRAGPFPSIPLSMTSKSLRMKVVIAFIL